MAQRIIHQMAFIQYEFELQLYVVFYLIIETYQIKKLKIITFAKK